MLHLPGQTHHGADLYQTSQHEQIEMVATTFGEFVLLPIDYHSRYLLIHEYQYRAEQGG